MSTNDEKEFLNKIKGVGRCISIGTEPQTAVNQYFQIKEHKDILKGRKDGGLARTTPITDLIAAKRQLEGAVKFLNAKRAAMIVWNMDTKAKWDEMEKNEMEFRTSFENFNLFVAENHEKRERAKEKIKNEKEIQKQRNEEIKEIEARVNYLTFVEKNLNSKVEEYQIYKNFLQQVAQKNKELSEIQNVLNRYETLAATRSSLGQKQAKSLSTVQAAREQLANKAEEQARIMMTLHTQLSSLRVQIEKARHQKEKWNAILFHVQNYAAQKAIEIQQVKSSCWDMYKTLTHLRRERMEFGEQDTEQQLVYITKRTQQLSMVVEIVKGKMKKSDIASNTNVVSISA